MLTACKGALAARAVLLPVPRVTSESAGLMHA